VLNHYIHNHVRKKKNRHWTIYPFSWDLNVLHRVYKSPSLNSIQNQMNPLTHILWRFRQVLELICQFNLVICTTCSALPILYHLLSLITVGSRHRLLRSALCNFQHNPCISSSALTSHIFHNTDFKHSETTLFLKNETQFAYPRDKQVGSCSGGSVLVRTVWFSSLSPSKFRNSGSKLVHDEFLPHITSQI
jgi:hypothetical protein